MKSLGEKIFAYVRPELERSVDGLFATMPGVSDSAPIVAEAVMEKMPDYVCMEPVPNLAQIVDTEAMVMTQTYLHRTLVVIIDWGIMIQRDPAPYNMALAEEIGHMHLHRAVMLEIHSYEDFMELQAHPRWEIAERDAKYWGRALLMPGHLLEPAAGSIYRRVATEMGFADSFQFAAVFTSHLAAMFEIPPQDAQKRIDSYVGDLRGRLERSIATRSDDLLHMSDTAIIAPRYRQLELSGLQLYGEAD